MVRMGPKYGYIPKHSKTILVVFDGTGITIDTEGERHLGAVIGNDRFKEDYVNRKIEKWIQDIEDLAKIAKDEPQLAYAAFIKALSSRWSFLQRTISGISHLFQPLEDVVKDKFIPESIGRKVSDIERQILALPVRYGGIGIQNPTKTSDIAYDASKRITETLTSIIISQGKDFDNLRWYQRLTLKFQKI